MIVGKSWNQLAAVVVLYVIIIVIGIDGRKKKSVQQGTCDASSNNCPRNDKGLESPIKSPSAAGDTDPDNQLAKELRRIEDEYLKKELTEIQKAKPKLVNHITEKLIKPALKEHLSDLAFMGSAYEFTTVPGKSDYDIQFFVKLPFHRDNHEKIYSAVIEDCKDPAWKRVKGGPENLQENGYLSSTKVRKLITSEIDKATQAIASTIEFGGHKAVIKRSTGGPATTLNVEWQGETISVDIVTCLKADDVGNSDGHDLVGKPYDKQDSQPSYWRLSYSRKECAELRDFHKVAP